MARRCPGGPRRPRSACRPEPLPSACRLPPAAPLPESFCDRSELLRPPRGRFSPMSGGMVRVMDHDCPVIGCCIGEGNHRAFLAMAISGELALLLCAHALLLHLAQRGGLMGGALRLLHRALAATHASAAAVVHARLLLLTALLCALLLLVLTPLLLGQVARARPASCAHSLQPRVLSLQPRVLSLQPAATVRPTVHATGGPLCPGFARREQSDHRRVPAHQPRPGPSPLAPRPSPAPGPRHSTRAPGLPCPSRYVDGHRG